MIITRDLLVSVYGTELDYTRLSRQYKAYNTWAVSGKKGTLSLAPRFGKTLIGCFAIDDVLEQEKVANIIVLCPSETVQNEWINSIVAYRLLTEEMAAKGIKIRVITPTTITNKPENFTDPVDLLIIDEIHKFTSEARLEIIEEKYFKYARIMTLSGTIPKTAIMSRIFKIAPIVDTITDSEALTNGWISAVQEYNVILELPIATKELYARHSYTISHTLEDFKGLNGLFQDKEGRLLFNSAFDLLLACYAGGKTHLGFIKPEVIRQSVSNRVGLQDDFEDKWTPNAIKERARVFTNTVRDRNELIIAGYPKLEAVIKIFEQNQVPTICFNESTEFADTITDSINEKFENCATCFHTAMKSIPLKDPRTGDFYRVKTGVNKDKPKVFGLDTLKSVAINGMITGDYKFLATARALDEGLTIAGIEQVITTAGTANPLQYLQRNARGRTVDIYNPHKITKVYNLTYNDFYITVGGNERFVKSRDKTKLQTRQNNMKAKWINMSHFI